LDEVRSALVAYGLEKLAEVTGEDANQLVMELGETAALDQYEALLGGTGQREEEVLSSIFSYIALRDKEQPPLTYLAAQPLALDEQTLFPVSLGKAQERSDLGKLWKDFTGEYDQLQKKLGSDKAAFFEGFYHLYHRYAWAVPCTHGERGVSLFEQWKAVVALVFASGGAVEPADNFTLIGGDIPGIQNFVYTITSKGAAKALRGRSLFIQFLGDAVVRRLVRNLNLSQANVIYAAGGNFMLLAPAGQSTQKVLNEVNNDVNRMLLGTYDGDVALCLAHVLMPAEVVGTAEFGTKYSLELKQAVARQKARRFVEIANGREGWQDVFAPKGGGGERAHFCAVCQAELSIEELKDKELLLVDVGELEPGETAPRACYNCATFRELAEAVGQPKQALYLHRGEEPEDERGQDWQKLLHKLSDGWWYRFAERTESARASETKYILNNVEFVKLGAHGFLFLANTTPRATQEDVEWWNETYPDQTGQVKPGSIRSFELLAHTAQADGALERVGVLRMDVDDLGRVMTRGLVRNGKPHRSMAATSTLSMALDRFFAGYLDLLCREVTEEPDMAGLPGHKDETLLYVIYAGGDDLFVVGSWHLLPLLAERLCDAFKQYVGGNPFLHISAGITLEGRKFPLYQAATQAGKALEGGAKKHEYAEDSLRLKKNAVHFLGQTLGWDDFAEVREKADMLVRLVKQEDVPRGLLQTLQMIYNRFVQDQKEARRRGLKGEQVYYGPWMWRQAYYLARFASGKPEAIQNAIERVQGWTLTHRIQYLGLAARWAEYLTRVKEG
jgi:CRISPR-associated protein Csm1